MLPGLHRVCLLAAIFSASTATADPWVFVSMPDFNNQDIGSIQGLATYDGGLDSTTASYEEAMDFIGQSLAAENPEFVAIAGDLVMGHWDRDSEGRQIFGPTNNLTNKRSAVEAAAAHYYPIWLRRFTNFGITNVVPALGDHELGDNNWNPGTDRASLVPDYKRVFVEELLQENGQHRFDIRPFGTPYEDTAYAFVQENVLFVTLDVFRIDNPLTRLDSRTGAVLATVDGSQLAWLDSLLADARQPDVGNIRGVRFIIVQGHVPVLFPARERTTSRVYLRDFDGTTNADNADQGADTDLWKMLVKHDVDLYLCGEIHDVTLSESGGVTQVVHGAITGQNSPVNYLKVTVHEDRLDLEIKDLFPSFDYNADLSGYGQGALWQTGTNRPPSYYEVTPEEQQRGYIVTGTATLDRSTGMSVLVEPTGKLLPFDGTYPIGLLVHLPFDGDADNAGLSGGLNRGVLQGDAVIGPGLLGQALSVAGDGRVLAGEVPALEGDPRTVSLWVRTSASGGLKTAATFGMNAEGGKFDLDIDTTNGGVPELGVGFGRTQGEGAPINDGAWRMLTYALPETGAALRDVGVYVDGTFRYSDADQGRAINTRAGSLIVGHAANSAYFQAFEGDVDDLALWTVPLSADEIWTLHAIAIEPALGYNAGAFNALRRVADGEIDEALIDDVRWVAASGISGSSGVTLGDEGATVRFGASSIGVHGTCADADFNADGRTNSSDIIDLLGAISTASGGDINDDGTADFFDVLSFLTFIADCDLLQP